MLADVNGRFGVDGRCAIKELSGLNGGASLVDLARVLATVDREVGFRATRFARNRRTVDLAGFGHLAAVDRGVRGS